MEKAKDSHALICGFRYVSEAIKTLSLPIAVAGLAFIVKDPAPDPDEKNRIGGFNIG